MTIASHDYDLLVDDKVWDTGPTFEKKTNHTSLDAYWKTKKLNINENWIQSLSYTGRGEIAKYRNEILSLERKLNISRMRLLIWKIGKFLSNIISDESSS